MEAICRLLAAAWLLVTYLPTSSVLVIGAIVAVMSTSATNPRPTGVDTSLARIAAEFAGDSPRLTTDRAILTGVTAVRPVETSLGTDIPEDALELQMRAFTVDGVDISSNGRGVRHGYATTAGGRDAGTVTAVVVINSMDLCVPPRELERAIAQTDAATRREARELARVVYDKYGDLPLGRDGLCVPAAELLPTIGLLTRRGAVLSVDAINLDMVLYRIEVTAAETGA